MSMARTRLYFGVLAARAKGRARIVPPLRVTATPSHGLLRNRAGADDGRRVRSSAGFAEHGPPASHLTGMHASMSTLSRYWHW